MAVDADPDAKEILPAYFFLGNSLDNLYKPSKKGEPANDALMENAVKYYQMAADKPRRTTPTTRSSASCRCSTWWRPTAPTS